MGMETATAERTENKFVLEAFQSKAFLSTARYLFMISGWATGKSLIGIGRAMKHCEEQPGALFLIARKEFTDLQDSTIKDFIAYTGLTPDSHREVKFKNGSVIMFRHLEELGKNNLQNINLSGAWIEQGEELETEDVFYNLFGRLRRKGFRHELIVSANASGHNWVWETAIGTPIKGSECIQATTFDNLKNLDKAFLDSLEIVKLKRPELYERMVMNNHEVGQEKMVVLPYSLVREAVDNRLLNTIQIKRVTVCDPTDGDGSGEDEADGDETVIYDFENATIKDQEIYKHRSPMDTCGRIVAHQKMNGSNLICIDKIGVGAGIYSRLQEIYEKDPIVKVYGFDSRVNPPDGIMRETYKNYKTYAWFQAKDNYFSEHRNIIPNDPILIKQLSTCPYKYTSNGQYILLEKRKIRQLVGSSPDRADA